MAADGGAGRCPDHCASLCLSLPGAAVTLAGMLAVHGLTKSFAGPRPRAVFADVDLELSPGDYVAVMGERAVLAVKEDW